jgi:hypothetical protein
MATILEHIRMEVGGRPPKVLHRSIWSGTESEFRQIARDALASYYKPGTIGIRDDLDTNLDQPAKNAEAIRVVDGGLEIYRYSLHDLRRDQNASRS